MKYDYRCREEECRHIWVEEHSINDDAESLGLTCPECNSHDVYKYFGNMRTVPIHFKGTGWAIVDSALDAIGMPKNIQNSHATKEAIKKM